MKVETLRAANVRLRTPGIDLEPQAVWSVLGKIADRHPRLNQYNADEEKQKFKIYSLDEKAQEQSLVIISKEGLSIASKEGLPREEWLRLCSEVLQETLDAFKISPLSVVHVDSQLIPTWSTQVPHAEVLYRLFGDGTNLSTLFQGMATVQFAPAALFWLSRDEQIICRLSVQSAAPINADMAGKYAEDYDLTLQCGVAKVAGYTPKTSIRETADKVMATAETLFAGPFKTAVIDKVTCFINSYGLAEGKPADGGANV